MINDYTNGYYIDPIYHNPFLKIYIPAYQAALAILSFEGNETLSSPFSYKVTVLPENLQTFRSLKLGERVTIAIYHANHKPQWFHGRIGAINYVGFKEGRLKAGELELVPGLWFAKFNCESRGYVGKTLLEIVLPLLKSHMNGQVIVSNVEDTAPIPYCVQYQESDLAFVEKLLAEHGIYYYFRHEQSKRHECRLVLKQGLGFERGKRLLHQNESKEEHLHRFKIGIRTIPETISGTMENSKIPTQTLKSIHKTSALKYSALITAEAQKKKYDAKYYNEKDASEKLDLRTKIRCLQEEIKARTIEAEGNCSNVWVGVEHFIESIDDPLINGAYYTTNVCIKAKTSPALALGSVGLITPNLSQEIEPEELVSDETLMHRDDHYQVQLKLQPTKVVFVPVLSDALEKFDNTASHSSVVSGVVSGVVLAKAIGTDEAMLNSSLLSHGSAEIKVAPEWERNTAFPWVRTLQGIAGNNFGVQYLPRTGQMVLLHFNQGIAHKPTILGALYSQSEKPIHVTEKQSGFKTQTLVGQIEESKGHVLCFDDDLDCSQVWLKSQGDKVLNVKGKRKVEIHGTRKTTIKQNSSITKAGEEYRITAKKKLRLHVGSSEIILDSAGVHIHADVIELKK